VNQDRIAAMADATRLTRQGRLAEATALIQRNLGMARAGGRPCRTPEGAAGLVHAFVPGPGPTVPQPPSRQRPHRHHSLPVFDLHRLRRPGPRGGDGDVDPGSPGGQFLDSCYTNAAGTRRYKLYVPSGYCGQSVPLVVMLHGGTQGVDDFATGTRMNEVAERNIFLVAYPEQARSANPMAYWNWFRPGDQVKGAGEPSLIAGITQEIMSAYPVDAGCVSIAGFSAGGAMAAVMADAYPDLYAAVGVHSGLPAGAAHDVPSALAAMRQGPTTPTRRASRAIPLIVFHGDRDSVVGPVNADRLVADALRTAGPGAVRSTMRRQVPDGHAYTRTIYTNPDGETLIEQWIVHQAGHAWSGGNADSTYTDQRGPDASAELGRFFGEHTRATPV
jgi:poly(hydroxyalkanoate) depolymerase family esterase